MNVRVDETGKHKLARGIDCLDAVWDFEVAPNTGDCFILNVDVGNVIVARGDDASVFDGK